MKTETLRRPICYGPIRVSTDGQAERGQSPQEQYDRIVATWEQFYKETHDWGYCVEDLGTSAYLPSGGSVHKTKGVRFIEREGGRKLYNATVEGDVVILDSVSRAFRSMSDCWRTIEAFRAKGVKIHFRDIPAPAGSLMWTVMLTVLSLVAEMESAMKSQRMRERAEWARQNGKPVNGSTPLGKKRADRGRRKEFTDDPAEIELAARIHRMHTEEGMTFKAILEQIEREYCEEHQCEFRPLSEFRRPLCGLTVRRVRWFAAKCQERRQQQEGNEGAA